MTLKKFKDTPFETYVESKDEYLSLKAIFQVAGVDLKDIDKNKRIKLF